MDLKKILIIVGSVLATIVLVVVIILFFSSKSSGAGEVNVLTEQAYDLINNGKKHEALIFLLDNQEQLDPAGSELLGKLHKDVSSALQAEIKEAEGNSDYLLAYELYSKLREVTLENERDAIDKRLRELEKVVREITDLQNAYRVYRRTFDASLNSANQLLQDFKEKLDNYDIGLIKTADFSKAFSSKITESNQILKDLDIVLDINNQELLGIHKDVINLMNTQHNMLLDSLKVKPENDLRTIEQFKRTYLSIKQQQVDIIQKLNQFAEKNNLKYISLEDKDVSSADAEKAKAEKSREDVESTEKISTTEEDHTSVQIDNE